MRRPLQPDRSTEPHGPRRCGGPECSVGYSSTLRAQDCRIQNNPTVISVILKLEASHKKAIRTKVYMITIYLIGKTLTLIYIKNYIKILIIIKNQTIKNHNEKQ